MPTPAWRQQTFTRKTDPRLADRPLWKPGDSIQLAIGQKDLARDAAPDGALLRAHRERRQARHAAHRLLDVEQPAPNGKPRVELVASPPPRAAAGRRRPAASRSSATASSRRRTPRSAPRTAIFGSFPIPIAGKTGTAEKVIDPRDGYPAGHFEPVVVVRLRAGGLRPTSSSARVIENGGHGGDAAAPAALKVFEEFFHKQATPERADPLRLMVDYASRAAGLPRRRERIDVASIVRRLDWVLLGAVAALVAYGLWSIAGITTHDVTGNPHYYVVRQALYAVDRGARPRRGASSTRVYRARWRPIFGGTARLILRSSCWPVRPRLEALARPRLLPLPALRVRQGAVRPRARRLPRRPRPPPGDPRTVAEALGLALVPICSSSCSPTSAPRSSTGRARRLLFVAGTPLDCTSSRSRVAGGRARPASSGSCRRSASPVLKDYQQQRLTGSLTPTSDPGARRTT